MTRISALQRRAIVLLFLAGSSPKQIGRLFRLLKADIEEVLRRRVRGR
jgi:hypothetical protein